jgi:uncharacterized membrane protein
MRPINARMTYIHVHVQTDILAAHLNWSLRVLTLVAVVGSVFPAHWSAMQAMFEWGPPDEEAHMWLLEQWMNTRVLPGWIRIKTEGAHCNQV